MKNLKDTIHESLRIGICDEAKVPVYESLRIGINDVPEPENLEDTTRLYRIDIFNYELYLDVHEVSGLAEKDGYVILNRNNCHSITYDGGQIPGKYTYITNMKNERFMYEEYDRNHKIRFLLFPEHKTDFYNVVELIFANAHTGRLTYQLKLEDICKKLNIDSIVNMLNAGFPKDLIVKTPTNILENIYKFKHE